MQGFDCKYIIFKNAVNMFERMDIEESIYEGLVEPSYKNLLWKIPTLSIKAVKEWRSCIVT